MTPGRVVATLFLPWLTARFLFKPRLGALRKDRVLDRLTFWRSVTGLVVIVAATYRYQSTGDVWYSTYLKATHTGRLAVLLLPVPFLVMLVVTRSGYRTQLLSGALRLLRSAALALAFFYLPVGLFFVLGKVDFNVNITSVWMLLALLAAIPVFIMVFVWFWCFWFCTIYWATRTGLWIGEIHPLLAPIVTTSLMLLITVQDVIAFNPNGVPAALWLTLNLGGTATTLMLSVVEYRHLRSVGYRFRTGPHPTNPTPPVPNAPDPHSLTRWTPAPPPPP